MQAWAGVSLSHCVQKLESKFPAFKILAHPCHKLTIEAALVVVAWELTCETDATTRWPLCAHPMNITVGSSGGSKRTFACSLHFPRLLLDFHRAECEWMWCIKRQLVHGTVRGLHPRSHLMYPQVSWKQFAYLIEAVEISGRGWRPLWAFAS